MVKSGAGRVKAAFCGAQLVRVDGPRVGGAAAAAWLPGSVGADVAGPLGLREIAAGAKTEGGDQFLFVDEPDFDVAVVVTGGQPPVRQYHQRVHPAALGEDHRLASSLLRPELDITIVAATG